MTTMREVNEYLDSLQHVGVKGMQWGVRRDARALATASRLRRVDEGTASRGDLFNTFLGKGRGGIGGAIGIKTAGSTAARIEGRVAKRQDSRAANAEKATSKVGLSSGQKKALAIGGTAAAIAGLAAAEASLHRSGKLSVSSLLKSGSTAAKGQQAVKHISNDAWKTQVKDFESLLKEGNDSLYKSMVTDAARAGIPTISRVDFNSIRA